MTGKRTTVRATLVLVAVIASTVLGSATAAAADLGDYLWDKRPLLVFAPASDSAQMVDTLGRIDASRCEFVTRDMVLGQVVTAGTSTLDGAAIGADEAQRLRDRYGVGAEGFAVVLIGKDGGEKWRTTEVPNLRTVYAVVDGMPMRSREARTDQAGC